MSENPYIEYNSSNLAYARKNRKGPTEAEKIMWEKVLRRKQTGYKRRRQKLLGPFIADFYCSSLFLVIEVDGSIHNNQYVEDTNRTDTLNDLGIKVIRYTNEQVVSDISFVKKDIIQKIEKRRNHVEGNHGE